MTRILLSAAVVAGLALAGCSKGDDQPETPATAEKAAGEDTLATALPADSKFAQAAKAAGLDATLAGPGPYTVLAPTDAAFDKLPAGALDTLLKPESRADLTAVLTTHILPGTILAADIAAAIEQGKGKATLPTMSGGELTATKEGDKIVLADSAGGKAVVTEADGKRSNGVVHQIDGVLMPTK